MHRKKVLKLAFFLTSMMTLLKFLFRNCNLDKKAQNFPRFSWAGKFCKMDYRSELLVSGRPACIQLVCTRMLICSSPMNTKDIPEDWKKDNTMPVLKRLNEPTHIIIGLSA